MPRHNKLLVLLIFMASASPQAISAPDDKSAVYMMMEILDVDFSDRETVEKRFNFILLRFVKQCSDITTPMVASDMIVKVHQLLGEAGLGKEETLLTLSNNLHSMTSAIWRAVTSRGISFKCAEVFDLYAMGRREGLTQEVAKEGVVFLISLFGKISLILNVKNVAV